jgi:hypothetical protein
MFKKIALVAVAALTLSFSAIAPASAATATLTAGSTVVTTGTTSATAIELPVPADNKVDTADVLEIALAGVANNTTVTATATNAFLVTATSTVDRPVSATSGRATESVATGTGTTAKFYVYTTSTAVGTVVVTVGTTATTYYVKGVAGALNNITVSTPANAAVGTVAKLTVAGADVFGNPVSGAVIRLQVIEAAATNSYDLTTGSTGTASRDFSAAAVQTVDLIATATVATAVTGLKAPVAFVKAQFKVVDLTVALAGKDAEIAALKAKYNSLAKKYNKRVSKKNRVKLIK